MGPADSQLQDLPGEPAGGCITFHADDYRLSGKEQRPLPIECRIAYRDLCDAPGSYGGSKEPTLATAIVVHEWTRPPWLKRLFGVLR